MIVRELPETMINCFKNFPTNVAAIAIIDTGSPQDTIDVMNRMMVERGIPGEVISRPWIAHFGFSRTEALRHAENVVYRVEKGLLGPGGKELKPDPTHPRYHINTTMRQDVPKRPLTREEYAKYRPDYSLEKYNFLRTALEQHEDWILRGNWYYMITDADNYILPVGKSKKEPVPVTISGRLTADRFHITTSGYDVLEGGRTFPSPFLFRVDQKKRWRWRLSLHEYMSAEFPNVVDGGTVSGIWMHTGRTGMRSANPDKYLADAFHLKRKVARKPLKGRYWYYLAQSYKDAGRPKDAYKAYVKCANTRGWVEEIYLSFLYAAQIALYTYPKKPYRFIDNILRAREMMDDQWDAPYEFMNYWAKQSLYRLGWDIGKSLVDKLPKQRTLHQDDALVGYKFYGLCGLCAWKSNAYEDAERLLTKALEYPYIPEAEKIRINGDLIAMRLEISKRAPPA